MVGVSAQAGADLSAAAGRQAGAGGQDPVVVTVSVTVTVIGTRHLTGEVNDRHAEQQ